MIKGFSIVICCYNSQNILKDTFNSLIKLSVPDGYGLELIFVDNNSVDDTKKVIMSFIENYPSFSIKYVNESNQGLNFARVSGIRSSIFEFIVFCDDDNFLFPDYLIVLRECFDVNKKASLIGGYGILKTNSLVPRWFIESDGFGYAVGLNGRSDGYGNFLNGAGMALKRDVAFKFCNISRSLLLSDRKGEKLSSGGDSELCLLVGPEKIYFSSSLKYYHFIQGKRLDLKYFYSLFIQFGKSDSYLLYYKIYNKDFFLSLKIILYNLIKFSVLFGKYYLFRKDDPVYNSKRLYYKNLILGIFTKLIFINSFKKRITKNINEFNS